MTKDKAAKIQKDAREYIANVQRAYGVSDGISSVEIERAVRDTAKAFTRFASVAESHNARRRDNK